MVLLRKLVMALVDGNGLDDEKKERKQAFYEIFQSPLSNIRRGST